MLPNRREINNDGFEATWSVSSFNSSGYYDMGVKFVDPANPYQQSMRSAKYGMLIIILVFVASLFVEFLTCRGINPIQYVVIGLSLVLFYSLLLAGSLVLFVLLCMVMFITADIENAGVITKTK